MKLLIFSDSHRMLGSMVEAVEEELPGQIFHLGDLERDAQYLADRFPRIPICSVPGNCDLSPSEAYTKLVTVGGKSFFLNHGHTYRVKYGYDAIINAACVARADVLLFGHTHLPYYTDVNGLKVINPGSVGYGGTYGVMQIENGKIIYKLKQI